MWRKERVYTCDICGAEEFAKLEFADVFNSYYTLPDGWKGSSKKNGFCICQKCAHGLKWLKIKQESEKGCEDD